MIQQTLCDTGNSQAASEKNSFLKNAWKKFKNYLIDNTWFRYFVRGLGVIFLSLVIFAEKGTWKLLKEAISGNNVIAELSNSQVWEWLLVAVTSICFSISIAFAFALIFDRKKVLKKLAGIICPLLVIAAAEIIFAEYHVSAAGVWTKIGLGFKDNILYPILFTFVFYLGVPEIAEKKRKRALEKCKSVELSTNKYPANNYEFGNVCVFMGDCLINNSSEKSKVYVNVECETDKQYKIACHCLIVDGKDPKIINKRIILEDVDELGWAYSRDIDKIFWVDIDYHVILVLKDSKEEIHLQFCDSAKEDKASAYYWFVSLLFAAHGVTKDSKVKLSEKCTIISMQDRLGINFQTDPIYAFVKQTVDVILGRNKDNGPEEEEKILNTTPSTELGYVLNALCSVDNYEPEGDGALIAENDYYLMVDIEDQEIKLIRRDDNSKCQKKIIFLGRFDEISLNDSRCNKDNKTISLRRTNCFSNLDIHFKDISSDSAYMVFKNTYDYVQKNDECAVK